MTQTLNTQIISCDRCAKSFDTNLGWFPGSTIVIKDTTRNFLKKTSWKCLCPECLQEIDATLTSLEGCSFPKPSELKKDFHYYTENEFCVFTAQYHILRGSCCKNGCRHCPYGFKK